MTPRPHNALFMLAFEAPASAAALLGRVLPAPVRDAVAWETIARVPASFVDPTLDEHFCDLLFSVRLQGGGTASLFVLLEHQSSEDPAMPQRALSYQTQLWERLRRDRRAAHPPSRAAARRPRTALAPVIAVVVNHVPGGWSCARSLDDMFDPALHAIPGLDALLPRFSILVEDLAHRSDEDLRTSSLSAFQQLALWLLRDARDPVALLASFDAWAPAMLQVEREPLGLQMLLALFTYMLRVVDPMHLDDLRAKIRRLSWRAEETAMTIADYFHEEGRKKGHEEGRLEGRKEGRLEGRKEGRLEGRKEGHLAALRSLLLLKFGRQALEDRHEARLRASTPAMLDRLMQRALVSDTLDAVFGDA